MPLSGKRRARDESDDSKDFRMRTIEPKPKTRLKRSNSVDQFGGKLSIADRHTTNLQLRKDQFKDYSVVAVFSREAFENFGKKWKSKLNDHASSLATKSSLKKVSPDDAKALLANQSRVLVEPDFNKQLQGLFDNKTMPHVIAVIEGKEERELLLISTTLDEKKIDVPYAKINYTQGFNSNGGVDNKQSMSIYVRDDMKKVYSVSAEIVTHLPSGKPIHSVALNYATVDGTQYRTLMVHIPNEFVGTVAENSDTHNSFRQYTLTQQQAAKPVVVTSYFGDTNYSSSLGKFSSPSIGGHASTGLTIHPQSSGAKKETHFMQSVPLSDGHSKHSVLQPSTLNYVFINPDAANREATDHPSIIQYVAHDTELAGKPLTDHPLKLLEDF